MTKKNQQSDDQPSQSLNPYAPGNPIAAVSDSNPGTLSGQKKKTNDEWDLEISRGPRGYGHSQAYGGALGYPDETLRTPENSQVPYDRVDRPKPVKIK